MTRRCLKLLLVVLAGFAMLALVRSAAGQYRGAPAGWPQNAGGYYASYPVSGSGQPYYVARPVLATQRPAAIAYVPVNAAYANPNYFGAYATTRAAYRPQVAATAYNAGAAAAYYPPAAAAYYPPTPATANYAPTSGYAISPAGSSYAGSEAATYFGQPTTVNYVPPRVTYRPAYAATPVYAYQPVVAYQVGAQPTTCCQPVAAAPVATGCGVKSCRRGFLSFLNPFNWFRRGGCGAATTAYCAPTSCYSVAQCGTASGCGQPYYPTQPTTVIPTVPAPAATIPSIRSPIIGTPTVPPPPTRAGPSTFVPADSAPSLAPGTIIRPGTSAPSGGSFTPSGGFGSPAPAAGGSFPSGSNYAPEEDPYAAPSVSGANYRSTPSSPSTIREPGASAANERQLAPSVRPIPDPDARQQRNAQPADGMTAPSRAPQLLDPRDKSAGTRFNRWAVVPAVWPTKTAGGRLTTYARPESSPYLSPQSSSDPVHALEPVKHFVPAAAAEYDDSGWASGR